MEILNWAVQTNSYIIENDYDSELHYRDMPIPSLQSIDSNHRVIYLGTFSKSISLTFVPHISLCLKIFPFT